MRQTLCIVVLFSVLAITLSTNVFPHAQLDKCTAKYNVSEDYVNKLNLHPETLFDDPEQLCFAACVVEENGIIHPNGTLNTKFLIEHLPKNIFERQTVVDAINSCANEKGADPCETARNSALCLNNQQAIRDVRPAY